MAAGSVREVTRRDFLTESGCMAVGLAGGTVVSCAGRDSGRARVRFGIAADAHYADTAPRGTRFFRESAAKLEECVGFMNEKKVSCLAMLGDIKDQDPEPSENNSLRYLETIETVFRRFDGRRYHVLGNHDLDSISKGRFLSRVDNTGIPSGSTFYSFDLQGVHLVVLDANWREDGVEYDHGNFDWRDTAVPGHELRWLEHDLAGGSGTVIVLVHQRLDAAGDHTVANAEEVRRILERSGRVRAVFQGHYHAGDYSFTGGIHYYTLPAMVEGRGIESSAYALVEVRADGSIEVTGCRKAESSLMKPATPAFFRGL